jgi:hypothetical protein
MDRVGDRTRCIQEMTSGMRLEVLKSRVRLWQRVQGGKCIIESRKDSWTTRRRL